MATTMKLIGKQTLGANAASVTFSSIPGTGYSDLLLVFSARSSISAGNGAVYLQFNASGSGYDYRALYGLGGAGVTGSFGVANQSSCYVGEIPGATATSNTFSVCSIYVPNYTGSTNKSLSAEYAQENNASTAQVGAVAGIWKNTAAITQLSIVAESPNNCVSGSSFYLYGITKA